ncbi:MAG: GIY-YIG nuclease family protein [Anaerolineales bacterium]|nr:GIY-YIG nuclease family protein [Anaerolineales bacterium]
MTKHAKFVIPNEQQSCEEESVVCLSESLLLCRCGAKNLLCLHPRQQTGTLYTGITNNLERRVLEHRQGLSDGFTKTYRVNLLLFYEEFDYIEDAIRREKEIKGWRREKKDELIASVNPRLEDLALGWFDSD